MYQFQYADVLSDDSQEARAAERAIFDTVIARLEAARIKGPNSQEAVLALHHLDRLWQALIEDLVHPGNSLPRALRRSLVQIGMWNLKETERLRLGQTHAFEPLIEINASIRDGLGASS